MAETALMDLRDTHDNTRDGLHLASLAGSWNALVAGFGGLRARRGCLSFAPRLPAGINRLAFRIRYRGRCIRVIAGPDDTTYELLAGDPLSISHHGRDLRLGADPVTADVPAQRGVPPLHQPRGRAPALRSQR